MPVGLDRGDDGAHSYSLTNDIAQPVLTHEYYALARGSAGAGTDLFDGLAPVEHAGADR